MFGVMVIGSFTTPLSKRFTFATSAACARAHAHERPSTNSRLEFDRMTLWVLKNANVLDADKGVLLSDRHVVIEDNLIREIATSDPVLPRAISVDLRGATLMPGLIDAHVHVTAYAADFGTLARSSPAYVAGR